MMRCREVAGQLVLSSAPAFLCTGSHYIPYLAVSIAVTAVLVVGLPIVLLALVVHYHGLLHQDSVLARWGFAYEAYRPNVAWFVFRDRSVDTSPLTILRFVCGRWEAVVMIRRSMLIGLGLIGDVSTSAICIACGCSVIAATHALVLPFTEPHINTLETLSLMTLAAVASVVAWSSDNSIARSGSPIAVQTVVGATALCLFGAALYSSRESLRAAWLRARSLCGESKPSQLQTHLLYDEPNDEL
jgi:hypothetical protein